MKTRCCIHALCSALLLAPFWIQAELPNILWITSEDNGPQLGCYGDEYAATPNLDGLAAKGMIYRYAWSTAPVCAPARTTIISGVYPTALGAQHMRSVTTMAPGMKMYPQFLREVGYYCTNNSKEDYNLRKPEGVWDVSSNQGHWRDRQPGQPFFAIFNHTVSHESQIRRRPHEAVHDPDRVRVPAYHPDHPAVRQDWAQYYDKITEMDARAGRNLRELEEAGLSDSTIVFYYGDHGAGMPRSKRWPYNSGLHVPLIVYVPEKFKHLAPAEYVVGGASERLVGFIDLAPTVLSLAGIKPPDYMQGHAFMGEYETPAPKYLHGFRGRMDERYDMVRSVRDERYIYIRHFMPHRIYGQYIAYMFQTPTTRIWKDLYDSGQLQPPRTCFWEPKPVEELYDLQRDPDEVRNLVESAEHRETLKRMREVLTEHAVRIRDVGFLPEAEIHSRAGNRSPYEMGHDESVYPTAKIMSMADLAARRDEGAVPKLKEGLSDSDSAVRYWAVTGILIRGAQAVEGVRPELRKALTDPAPMVRVVAAEALGSQGQTEDLEPALDVLLDAAVLDRNGLYVSLAALNALGELGPRATGRIEDIKALPREDPGLDGRLRNYVPRLLDDLVAALEDQVPETAR